MLAQLDGLAQEAFLAFVHDQILNHPMVIPFAPCTANCPDWLPDETRTVVDVTLSEPRLVQIVDDRAYLVASAKEIAPLTYRMEFEPAASTHYLSPGIDDLPFNDAQATTSFNLRSYSVEIWLKDSSTNLAVTGQTHVETTLGLP